MNMKKIIHFINSLFLISFISPQITAANSELTINLSLEIIKSGCQVSSDDLSINLETWDTKYFKKPNSESTLTQFKIDLINCSGINNAQVKFVGSSSNSKYLEIENNNSSAKNIAIKLYNHDKTVLSLNEYSVMQPIIGKSSSLNFFANYISENGGTTPGSANATATFYIKYD